MHGRLALKKFTEWCSRQHLTAVLDIGSGKGEQAAYMTAHGLDVWTVALAPPAQYIGDYNDISFPRQFGGVWACHVLEHQPDVQSFLTKLYRDTLPNGIVAVTVPPAKAEIVGGHVSLWNAGLLLYRLVLAGFDCSQARVKRYDYNISVIVRKRSFTMPALTYTNSDLKLLKPYFPPSLRWTRLGFDGNIDELNWT